MPGPRTTTTSFYPGGRPTGIAWAGLQQAAIPTNIETSGDYQHVFAHGPVDVNVLSGGGGGGGGAVTQSGPWSVSISGQPILSTETSPVYAVAITGVVPNISVNQLTSPWIISGAFSNTSIAINNQITGFAVTGSLPAGTNTLGFFNSVQSGPWSVSISGQPVSATLTNPVYGVAITGTIPSVTVNQGTSPWVVSGAISNTSFEISNQLSAFALTGSLPAGTNTLGFFNAVQSGPWSVSISGQPVYVTETNPVYAVSITGTVPNITVVQGTSPWIISGAISNVSFEVSNQLSALSITGSLPAGTNTLGFLNAMQSGPWSVSISGQPISVTETNPIHAIAITGTIPDIIVNQGTSPWIVSGVTDNSSLELSTIAITGSLPAGINTVGFFNAVQSGPWSVAISGQPIQVSESNPVVAMAVTGTVPPITVTNTVPITGVVNARPTTYNSFLTGFAQPGTSGVPIRISSGSMPANLCVQVKADDYNLHRVFVGSGSDISLTNGFPLAAGQGFAFPVNNANLIWMVAPAANQKLNFMVF